MHGSLKVIVNDPLDTSDIVNKRNNFDYYIRLYGLSLIKFEIVPLNNFNCFMPLY